MLRLVPSQCNEAVACEYAKCKNPESDFAIVMRTRRLRVDRASGREDIAAMTDDPAKTVTGRKPLSPAAQRALAEAEERRRQAAANARPMEKEYQGPKGPEPTRYGDWENKGIASDF
jgi:hypothetical protein